MAADRIDPQRALEQRTLGDVRDLLDKLEARERDQARIDAWFVPKFALIIALGLSLIYGVFVVGWWLVPWKDAATKHTPWRLELTDARGAPRDPGAPGDYVKHVLEKIGYTAKASAIPVGMTGTVKMTIAVRKDGAFESVEINRSSGDINIDREAISLAMRAAPFRPLSDFGISNTEVIYATGHFRFARGECKGSAI
jgi:TonB family protein